MSLGIHILNRNTGEIETYLTNNSRVRTVLQNSHKRNADDHSETFDFSVPYKYNNDLNNENRVLIPDEIKKRYREFTIKDKTITDHVVNVECDAAWLNDLNRNSEPILPFNHQNITVDEAVDIALARTGYEKGNIEFDGFIDFVTTEIKTPYELLLMIEELTGLVLDFYIQTSGNEILSRKVAFYESKDISEFTGKEFVRGRDITGIVRKENTRDLVTALILTSTDAKGQALVTKVYDDDARDRWNGESGKYTWGIYNIEATEKDKMTTSKMETIGRKVLKKMINSLVEYEVSAITFQKEFNESIKFLDKVRVRDVLYQPHLYAEAIIKGIERDIFDDSSKTFTLGSIKTYSESSLRKYFTSLSSKFQEKLNDNINNVNDIIVTISEQVAANDIHKDTEPPSNPPINKLWLDTSTQPAILKRWNGSQWIIDSPTKPEDVGAVAKESAMIDSLEAVYKNIANQHLELQAEVTSVSQNEYLIDEVIKNELTQSISEASAVFLTLGQMIQEKQTLAKPSMVDVIEVQTLLDDYGRAIEKVRKKLEAARKAINDRFKLLQSQYTQERVNAVYKQVADATGLIFDEAAGTLTGDINLTDATVNKVYEKVNETFKGDYVSATTYSTDQNGIVTKLNNQQSAIERTAKELNLEVSDSRINNQLKTLQQAISAIKILADGVTITSGADGLISKVSVSPEGVFINGELINISDGDIIIKDNKATIKNAVINNAHIDLLSLDVMHGGTLNIGGYEMVPKLNSDGTPMYEQVLDDNGDLVMQQVLEQRTLPPGELNFMNDSNEILFQISSENKGADKFSVNKLTVRDKIENDYIVTKEPNPKTIYVYGLADEDIVEGYDESDGSYTVKTINDAIDLIPDILIGTYSIFIAGPYYEGDPAEEVIIKGKMGDGSIDIDFQNSPATTTRFSVNNCQCRVYIRNANFNYLDDGRTYMLQNYFSNWVEFNNITLNGNGTLDRGISCYGGGNTYITGCEIQNVKDCVWASMLNNIYMSNNKGKGSQYGAIAWRGSSINIYGTAPIGVVANATKTYAGNINTTDATYPTVTTKTPTTTSTTKTKTWTATSSNYYLYSGYNKWATSSFYHYGYPIVGYSYRWSPQKQVGAWFFGSNMRDTLKGKTVKKITVKLTRRPNVGNMSNVKVHLRMHKHASQPSGAPVFSSDYKEIIMDWNEPKTVDVTSLFKTEIASGDYYGFGLKPTVYDEAHYAELSKSISVTVTYV